MRWDEDRTKFGLLRSSVQEKIVVAEPENPNHAQAIDDVMGAFQAGITALGRRAAEIKAGTDRAFGKVNMVFDHADHVNSYIEGKADSLSRFLGPPPNSINMPKIEDKSE